MLATRKHEKAAEMSQSSVTPSDARCTVAWFVCESWCALMASLTAAVTMLCSVNPWEGTLLRSCCPWSSSNSRRNVGLVLTDRNEACRYLELTCPKQYCRPVLAHAAVHRR